MRQSVILLERKIKDAKHFQRELKKHIAHLERLLNLSCQRNGVAKTGSFLAPIIRSIEVFGYASVAAVCERRVTGSPSTIRGPQSAATG